MNEEIILNTTLYPILLVDEDKLNNIAWEVMNDVTRLLRHVDGMLDCDVSEIRSRHKVCYVAKIFTNPELGIFDQKYLNLAVDWCRLPGIKQPSQTNDKTLYELTFRKKIEDLRFRNCNQWEKTSKSIKHTQYVSSLRRALLLFLSGLWARKAVLLPGNLNILWDDWILNSPELSSTLNTSLMLMIRKFRGNKLSNSNINNQLSSEQVLWSTGSTFGLFIQTTNFREAKDVSLEKFINVYIQFRNHINNTTIGVDRALSQGLRYDILAQLLIEQNSDIHFSFQEYLDAKKTNQHNNAHKLSIESRMRNASTTIKLRKTRKSQSNQSPEIKIGSRLFSTILADLWPNDLSIDNSDQLFKRTSELKNRSQFSPKYIINFLEAINESSEVIKSASDWVIVQNAFMKSKRYANENGVNSALAILNAYLFYYLPFWFNENANADCKYPYKINELNGVLYINRPIETRKKVPKTLFELIEKRH